MFKFSISNWKWFSFVAQNTTCILCSSSSVMKCTLHTEDALVKVLKIVFILCIVVLSFLKWWTLHTSCWRWFGKVTQDSVFLVFVLYSVCLILSQYFMYTSCWMVLVLVVMTPQLENYIDCLVSNKSVFMKHVLVVAHVFSIILKILQ